MKYFVFDLEATCWTNNAAYKQEIIEFGACIVDHYGKLEKSFSSIIKPVLNPTLSSYCKGLTKISQQEVDSAKSFPVVINKILDWAEIPDEEYIFCAWGAADLKLLQNDSKLHNIEFDWLHPYVDIKAQYHRNKEIDTTSGLYKVLKHNGFEFEGNRHRALSDAVNLARIVAKYIDEWVY
ncbi:MAG: 3'-5' exonuclease [Saprospiraceae bacterium]